MATKEDATTQEPIESSESENNSGSESDNGSESGDQARQVEWLATGRAKRSTAGNRMKSMLANEEVAADDSDLELLFAEDEDDVGFTDVEDASDVQMDSSSDEEDANETGADDLEGEKELQRQAKEKKAAMRKRKAQEAIPMKFRKKVRISQPAVGPGAPAAPAPRPKKKSERASWLPSAADLPTRSSERGTTRMSKEQLHHQLVERELKRKKQLEAMEKKAKKLETMKKPPMTQAERLAEAARVEIRNSKSLNRWEEAEKQREEERKAKLAALNNRRLEGPVVTFWSGIVDLSESQLKNVGKMVTMEEKPRKKRQSAAAAAAATTAVPEAVPKVPEPPESVTRTDQAVADVPIPQHASSRPEEVKQDLASPAPSPLPNPPPAALDQPAEPSKLSPPSVQTAPKAPTPPPPPPPLQAPSSSLPPVTTESHTFLPPPPPPRNDVAPRLMAPPPVPPPADVVQPQPQPQPSVLAAPAAAMPNVLNPPMPMTGFGPPPGMRSNVLAAPSMSPVSSPLSRPPSMPAAPITSPPPIQATLTPPGASSVLPPVQDPIQRPPTPPPPPPSLSQAAPVQPSQPRPPKPKKLAEKAEAKKVEEPPAPEPPLDGKVTRTCIILQNFDEAAIKQPDVQTQILFGRKMNKLKKPAPPPHCVVTNHPARYRDPKTGLLFYNAYSYREIQRLRSGDYKWSSMGLWVGTASYAARGVPPRFLDEHAPVPGDAPATGPTQSTTEAGEDKGEGSNVPAQTEATSKAGGESDATAQPQSSSTAPLEATVST